MPEQHPCPAPLSTGNPGSTLRLCAARGGRVDCHQLRSAPVADLTLQGWSDHRKNLIPFHVSWLGGFFWPCPHCKCSKTSCLVETASNLTFYTELCVFLEIPLLAFIGDTPQPLETFCSQGNCVNWWRPGGCLLQPGPAGTGRSLSEGPEGQPWCHRPALSPGTWGAKAWHAAIFGVTKSQTWLSDWTELNQS